MMIKTTKQSNMGIEKRTIGYGTIDDRNQLLFES
jgi:hypothetical protein